MNKLDELIGIMKDVRWELQNQRKFNEEFRRSTLWELQTQRRSQAILVRAAVQQTLLQIGELYVEKQYSFFDTLDYIRENRASFSRYGDGELKLMLRSGYKLKFQANSPSLAADLLKNLMSRNPGLLIGLPHLFSDLHWSEVWLDIWGDCKSLFGNMPRFGNSHVSRPVFFEVHGQAGVEKWRSVWNDLNICVITGKGSRFELIPELFDNVNSVSSIDSLPENAYTDLPTIVSKTQRQTNVDLFLIALGPAGTILASELSKLGFWAIDIGHISNSYNTVFNNGSWPEALPHNQITSAGRA